MSFEPATDLPAIAERLDAGLAGLVAVSGEPPGVEHFVELNAAVTRQQDRPIQERRRNRPGGGAAPLESPGLLPGQIYEVAAAAGARWLALIADGFALRLNTPAEARALVANIDAAG